jgi:hypothetical protein
MTGKSLLEKKSCNAGVATVLAQVFSSNGKQLKTEAFKTHTPSRFLVTMHRTCPYISVMFLANAIYMTQTIKVKCGE